MLIIGSFSVLCIFHLSERFSTLFRVLCSPKFFSSWQNIDMLEQCFPFFLTKWHGQKIRIAFSALVKVEKGS